MNKFEIWKIIIFGLLLVGCVYYLIDQGNNAIQQIRKEETQRLVNQAEQLDPGLRAPLSAQSLHRY